MRFCFKARVKIRVLLWLALSKDFSACFLIQSRTTCSGIVLPVMFWLSNYNHESIKFSTDMSTYQSNGGNFLVEFQSFQICLNLFQVDKTYLAQIVLDLGHVYS